MPYTISDAVADVLRQVPSLSRAITREPLSGIVDGVNRLFRLPVIPGRSGTLSLHDADGTAVSSGYTVDYDTGLVSFAAPPTVTHYATYTAMSVSESRLRHFARDGFAEMQRRLPRKIYLVDSGPETYFSSDPTAVVEPVLGGLAFSVNPIQLRLYHLCVRYVILESDYEAAATQSRLVRESGRLASLMVDETRVPDNIAQALQRLDRIIDEAVSAASMQEGGGGFGDWVPGARSDEHIAAWDWWTGGRQDYGEVE